MEGWLEKRSKDSKTSWKKRYAVLRDSIFRYSKTIITIKTTTTKNIDEEGDDEDEPDVDMNSSGELDGEDDGGECSGWIPLQYISRVRQSRGGGGRFEFEAAGRVFYWRCPTEAEANR